MAQVTTRKSNCTEAKPSFKCECLQFVERFERTRVALTARWETKVVGKMPRLVFALKASRSKAGVNNDSLFLATVAPGPKSNQTSFGLCLVRQQCGQTAKQTNDSEAPHAQQTESLSSVSQAADSSLSAP